MVGRAPQNDGHSRAETVEYGEESVGAFKVFIYSSKSAPSTLWPQHGRDNGTKCVLPCKLSSLHPTG